MFYIHHTACISPQQSFPPGKTDLGQVDESLENKLIAREPSYEGLSKNAARRMSKSVRMGVGTALALLSDPLDDLRNNSLKDFLNGIIIGTAHTGMEESIQFMKQIMEHEEEMLTPGAFVQSTPNTLGSQISFLTRNKGYNITHVHSGLAFENALIDAAMLLKENPSDTYLLGAADEIGVYNYNIDYLDGWYKKEPLSNKRLYEGDSPGSLAGEGAAMFLINNKKENALAKVQALSIFHGEEPANVTSQLKSFLDRQLQQLPPGEKIDLLLTGENGDNRLLDFFSSCEAILDKDVTIARFKHMSGEYPTATAFALWLACSLPGGQPLPPHMIKKPGAKACNPFKNVLIYNKHRGNQHSFMLVEKVGKLEIAR
ncbi:beta-ketoacyl synthase chain length factor [Flavitalea flava]